MSLNSTFPQTNLLKLNPTGGYKTLVGESVVPFTQISFQEYLENLWAPRYREKDRFGVYLQNKYLFQMNKSWPILKDRGKWNLHWLTLEKLSTA